mmetsp:Transcript_23839/g.38688  ORF Transcript_23839/g.38688 Transcript_23839/m.38688 type:complete len:201 (+) Transcript_23839:102-704(+)|eukprot:CAMPEP_0196178758 /NCGR_PEP_ID=MMETSP0911-20130528/18168_1 /TAXON_ID=49265 /ORGANISM="Thalassiosira rotula, Strain GSO102" /LENGTH=200 /DNA_ID=CAMNT_0041447261 /DNA_START=93 /DNA_END=695 /DNA_ORIENTATION=+
MTTKAKINRNRAAIVLLLSLAAATLSNAFVAPSPSQRVQYKKSTSLSVLPEVNQFLLADGLSAATRMGDTDMSYLSGPLSTLRTFFIVILASVFGLTAIAYLTASFLVPKAAEQLERDTKRLDPGLWLEYEQKLEDGESMVNRPDLLQELGNKIQPLIVKEYENAAAVKFGDKNGQGIESSSGDSAGTIIDATIEKTEDK